MTQILGITKKKHLKLNKIFILIYILSQQNHHLIVEPSNFNIDTMKKKKKIHLRAIILIPT